MKVIKPITIDDTRLVSSSVPETEYAAWSVGTTYAAGDRCIAGHVVYESLDAGNVGNAPATSPLAWLAISPSNAWAMFDTQISTATQATTSLSVTIKPGNVSGLALFGLVGTSATITVRDGLAGPVVYTKTVSLDGTPISDWYAYFFEDYQQLGELVLTDLPLYYNAHVTITVTAPTGYPVAIGTLLLGKVYVVGDAQYGATAGILDYSRKSTSDTGVTTFVERAYSKRTTQQLVVQNAQLNTVYATLAALRATPAAWICTDLDTLQPLNVYGFYKDFSLDVQYATESLCSLEIEGLT